MFVFFVFRRGGERWEGGALGTGGTPRAESRYGPALGWPENAMDLSTKLKITAVMAAVLMAVAWAVPVPV